MEENYQIGSKYLVLQGLNRTNFVLLILSPDALMANPLLILNGASMRSSNALNRRLRLSG